MKEVRQKLPKTLLTDIIPYLHHEEKIIDYLKEVWVPRFDFSWIVLTNERIIVATRKLFEVKFVDYFIKNIDMDLSLGFPFDTLSFEVFRKKYTGQFYWFNRKKTLGFVEKIETKIEANERIEEKRDKAILGGKEEKECEPLESLKRLADLRKQGIITEEEFQEKKKKLLRDI